MFGVGQKTPSWKKIGINIEHAASGHLKGGWRTGCKGSNKSLFPENMTKTQLEKAIRHAYKNGKKVKTRGEQVVVHGEYQGLKIEMHVNTKKKIIATAYPING